MSPAPAGPGMPAAMKTRWNALDERIMNIVSFIADQVQTRKDLFSDEGRIMDSLVSSGYRLHEADAALTLMQSLARPDSDAERDPRSGDLASMRAMSTEERSRFSIDAFSFITKLAALGVISEVQREDILERSMSLRRGRITLDEVKALIALDLFADDQAYDDLLTFALERKGTAWN